MPEQVTASPIDGFKTGWLVTVKRTGEHGTITMTGRTASGKEILKVRVDDGAYAGKVIELLPKQVEVLQEQDRSTPVKVARTEEKKVTDQVVESDEVVTIELQSEEEVAKKAAKKAEQEAKKAEREANQRAKAEAKKEADAKKAEAKAVQEKARAEKRAQLEADRAIREQKAREKREAELNGEELPKKKKVSRPKDLSLEPFVLGEGLCQCGCGLPVIGKKAKFVPGHDARLKGRLIRFTAWMEEHAQEVDEGKLKPEIDFDEYQSIPSYAFDELSSCSCCGQPMLRHESGMGPICRAGKCKCAERGLGQAVA